MDKVIQNEAKLVQGITAVNGLSGFGLLYVNNDENSKICTEPRVTLPNGLLPWVIIKEKKEKGKSEDTNAILKSVISARGLSCAAIGIAAIGGAFATVGTGGLATPILSLAGASLALAAHQCSVYITQVGQSITGNSDHTELYDDSSYASVIDRTSDVVSVAAGVNSITQAGKALINTPNAMMKMQFETGLITSKGAAKTIKVLISSHDLLIQAVFNILGGIISISDSGFNGNIRDLYDVTFGLTETKKK